MTKGIERPNLCPFCGYRATHVDNVSDGAPIPQDGDVSLCIGCGEFSIFTGRDARVLRQPTAAEAAEHAVDAELVQAKAVWRAAIRQLGRPRGGYHSGGQA